MRVLAGPFVVAAALLGLGGALELHRPAATVGAMRVMGLPAGALAVRLGGASAVAISVVAVVWPGRVVAAVVAVVYLMLAGFVLAALRRETPLGSCGCFGRTDTPATVGHVAINVAAALVAGAVALTPGGRGWESVQLDSGPFVVVLFVVLTSAATWFTYLALTLVPRLVAQGEATARRPT